MRNNYIKATISLVMLTLFSFTNLMAQNISGVVNDENGEPLPGASVLVVGTTNGTTTDFDGNFSIDVSDDQATNGQFTLSASFMGYQNAEKIFSVGSDQVWSPQLQPDASVLEDVVVIGYGTVKKEDATGAVTAISAKDFNPGAISSPQDLLIGKTSGVQITSAGGAPGSGATIRIRGGSSMSASNDPLIIIDGVPMDTDGVAGMRNPLNTINPNDIATFTVLKDASATAIYGSRASNGVIIITTKIGKVGKTKFNYSGNVSVSQPAGKVDVMNADQYRSFVTGLYGDGSSAVALLGNSKTDWQDEIFRTSISTDHNFSASGAVADIPYRASLGYSNQNGILKTSNLERLTGSLNINPTFLDDHLKLSANAKVMKINNRFANGGAVGSAVVFDPTQSVNTDSYPGDRSYGGYTTWTDVNGLPIPIAPFNPVAQLEMHENTSNVWRYILGAKLDYKLHFLPSVTATLNMALDGSQSDGSTLEPANAPWTYQEEGTDLVGGANNMYTQDKSNKLLDFYLTWTPDLKDYNSTLNVMGGYSWQHFYREGYSKNSNVRGDEDRTSENVYKGENYLVSFMGRAEYGFMNKYLVTMTVRQDGSSRFQGDNQWGIFPAAAFAWKLKNESFLANTESLSNLKLRLGWGVTGQQNITGNDYPAIALYTKTQNDQAMYPWGDPNNWIYTYRPEDYDPNLKWEETTTYNIGLDFGFVKDRIYGSVDVYTRETKNLINTIPLPAGGLKNIRTTNVGNLTNRGVEVSLNFRPIVTEDMFWEIGTNFTYNVNEVTKLTNVNDPKYLGVETGGISGGVGSQVQIHSVGYPTYSYFVYEQVYDDNGSPLEGVYVDRNGDGIINSFDKYRYKQAAPVYMIGLNTRFEYKNFDFSASGRIQLGNYAYNNNQSANGVKQNTYTSTGFLSNRLSSASGPTGFNDYQYWSDMYVQDASFFRMDNISVGYNFKNFDKIDLRVNLTAQNVFVITDYTGLDPEIGNGIDNNFYPRPRTFVLGVNLGF